MKHLKYILFTFSVVLMIVFLYNMIMSDICLDKCDRDESCWKENQCGIGI